MTLEVATNQLFEAARTGNVDAARVALDAGANVNARDDEGQTPLHWAAECGHIATARLLVEAAADIAAKDRWRETPLKKAAKHRHGEIVQMLNDVKCQEGLVGRLAKLRASHDKRQIGS